jgi:ribosomal protein L24E
MATLGAGKASWKVVCPDLIAWAFDHQDWDEISRAYNGFFHATCIPFIPCRACGEKISIGEPILEVVTRGAHDRILLFCSETCQRTHWVTARTRHTKIVRQAEYGDSGI